MKKILAASTAATLALLTGCGASQPAQTVTVTVTSTPGPISSATTAAVDAQVTHALGERVEIDEYVTATVLERSASVIGSSPYRGFLVETCAGIEAIQVSAVPWLAVGASGGRYQAGSIVGATEFSPAYPSYNSPAGALTAGECLQGWMTFQTDEQLTELRYVPSGSPSATWSLT